MFRIGISVYTYLALHGSGYMKMQVSIVGDYI